MHPLTRPLDRKSVRETVMEAVEIAVASAPKVGAATAESSVHLHLDERWMLVAEAIVEAKG